MFANWLVFVFNGETSRIGIFIWPAFGIVGVKVGKMRSVVRKVCRNPAA
jgi:hypothetical protein